MGGFFNWQGKTYACPEQVNRAHVVAAGAYECDHSRPSSCEDLRGRLLLSGTPVVFRSRPNGGAVWVGNLSFGVIVQFLYFEDAVTYNAYAAWSHTHDPEASVRQNAQASARRVVYETREAASAAL